MAPPEAGMLTRTVPFASGLAAHGDRPALITATGEISYRDLAARVDAVARQLGSTRRLVLLAAANTVDSVVAYLAALSAGHPLLLAPGGAAWTEERRERSDQSDEGRQHRKSPGPARAEASASITAMIATYDPDVVIDAALHISERRAASAHELHPDLALLLSTSGSTGSAKLVRLSADNLRANAESIARYLAIRADDRAATTLPLHYCYGLSVVNSHLLRGAGLILTDLSVADPRFWDLFRTHRGTSFAGVPYTFDLLDRVGFEAMDLPHLRYVTQAGGRLAPDRVRHYASLGQRAGWDLFVMYGQTEATARMAYLPPDLALAHPDCIGVAIPGGSLRLEPLPDRSEPDTGELVYSGPNVMMGYAESPSDLRLGSVVGELRTGDVARLTGAGLYQIVGRRGRFIKVYGLRIDLARVEAALGEQGVTACCAGDDGGLVVVVAGPGDPIAVARLAARVSGLPERAVRIRFVAELPRLANGKPDQVAVAALAGPHHEDAGLSAGDTPRRHAADRPTSIKELCRLYAEVLGRADVSGTDTFAGLGGDSLSYVEMSVRLERALGHLPAGWHTTQIRDLIPEPRVAGPRRRRMLDTGIALRAIAILLVVGTHVELFGISGGAHLLLGVAGYNVARFHLTATARGERIRNLGRSVRRIAVTSMTWIALAYLFLPNAYTVAQVFLVNYFSGRRGFNDFWFIETLVYILLGVLALVAVPAVDRTERRLPFALPMALMAVGLVTRYHLIPGVKLPTPLVAFWLFALGWAIAKATGPRQRLLVSLAVVATVPGFFGDPAREAVVVAGLLLLVWVPAIPSTRILNRVAGVLAGASLYIYLIHWQVFPHLYEHSSLLAWVASIGAGVAYAAIATAFVARLRLRRAGREAAVLQPDPERDTERL